jgi:uncharacterized protein (TIRG00374 family)
VEKPVSPKKAKRKMLLNILYIVFVISLVMFIALREQDFDELIDTVRSVSPTWLLLALGAMAGFYFLDAASHQYSINCLRTQHRLPFFECMRVTLIGQFYNAVTPSASGGQPMQVVAMAKQGVSVGVASSVLMLRFVCYELSMALLCSFAFITQWGLITQTFASFIPFFLFGLVLAVGASILMIVAMVNINGSIRLANAIIRWLAKIRLIRRPEKAEARMHTILTDFHACRELITTRPLQMAITFLLVLAHICSLFMVTFFVFRAFGAHEPLWNMLFLQAFFHISVSYVPTPGASGAVESGFLLFYRKLFARSIVVPTMLVWRFITYYTKIIIGAVIVLIDAGQSAIRARRGLEQTREEKP